MNVVVNDKIITRINKSYERERVLQTHIYIGIYKVITAQLHPRRLLFDMEEEPQVAPEVPARPARPAVVAVVQHNHQAVTIFDGSNSLNFKMAFTNFARQQGFWDLIDGTRLRPDGAGIARDDWDRQNGQALNSLRSWIAPKILHIYLYCTEDTAREVWLRYERRTGGHGAQARRSAARQRVQNHFQKQGEPLEEWIAELNARFMDLEISYDGIPGHGRWL